MITKNILQHKWVIFFIIFSCLKSINIEVKYLSLYISSIFYTPSNFFNNFD